MNFEQRSNGSERLAHLIKQGLGVEVVLWSQPLVFKHAPQHFSDVEVRTVARPVKHEQAARLPVFSALLDLLCHMSRSVVQNHNRHPLQTKRQAVELLDDKRALMAFWVVSKWHSLARDSKAKQLRPAPFALGMKTSASLNCQAYGTHGSVAMRLSSP